MTAPVPPYKDPACGHGATAQVPDVVGTITGLRGWQIDPNGNLRGCTYPVPWTPGENTARCMVARSAMTSHVVIINDAPIFGAHAGWIYPENANADVVPIEGFTQDPCDGLDPDCGCGFYAFYDADTARQQSYGSVRGAIEGWGRIVAGPKGFRAQHARVVAIVKPHQPPKRISGKLGLQMRLTALDKAQSSLHDVDWFSRRGKWFGIAAAYTQLVVACTVSNPLVWAIIGAGAVIVLAADFIHRRWMQRRAINAIRHAIDQTRQMIAHIDGQPVETVEALLERFKARYPDVKVYDTLDELLANHPPSNVSALFTTEDHIERGDQ